MELSPITRRRLRKFRRVRRGYVSLWILAFAYAASLGAELFIGNRPLYVSYGGSSWFPAFTSRYLPEALFGGTLDREADFRELAASAAFRANGGRIVMALHPFSPLETVRVAGDPPPSRPSRRHPLGTDDRGRDVLARIVYGFRTSISFALILATASFVLGVAVGGVQGFYGGRADLVIQRVIEVWTALPFFYVVVLVSAAIRPNFWLLVAILMLFGWIGISRYVRAEVLRERSLDYVTAARSIGASSWRILFRHVLGNAMTPVVTLYPFAVAGDIFALTALDYLGFGLPAPTASWGELLKQGQGNFASYWLIGSPFAALFLTLLLTSLVGEAAREAWDPREYQRRE